MRLSLFLAILTIQLQAQTFISGTVLDATDLSPIDFAHVILLSQQHIGAITDEDGHFQISLPESYSQDSLVITRIGYQDYYIPLSTVSAGDEVKVQLKPQAFTLKEATVVANGGLKHLIRRAFAKRADNYPSEKHRLKVFYREYSTVDEVFTHLSEAFLTIQDESYHESTATRVYLQELRRSRDERHLPPQLARGSGHNEWLNSYDFNNVLNNNHLKLFPLWGKEDFLDSCRFTYLGASTLGADTLIRIGYTDPRFKVMTTEQEPWYYVRGEVVINKTDLAFVEYLRDFGLDSEKSPLQEIHYQKIDGKYYPQYISYHLGISYNQETTYYAMTNLFHIYEVETDRKQFSSLKGQKRIGEEQSFWDLRYRYHPAFWKDHPVVRQFPIPDNMQEKTGLRDLEKEFGESARRVE